MKDEKTKEPKTVVKIKLLPLDCGKLSIETKYGQRVFWHNLPIEVSKQEAEELIKIRTAQRKDSRRPGCDLVICDD